MLLNFILILPLHGALAQQITGFWEVQEVKAGNKIMTPVAKWTKINKDHTFQSGNGWLQNSAGTWTYDKKRRAFLPKETNGIVDESGPFTVRFKNEKMIWQREEEGMKVTVTLKRITQLPISTAEQLAGLWDLTQAIKDGDDITYSYDPDNKHYIFIRWDRIFVERTTQSERSTGFWYINSHRPELTLINHDKNIETWQVSVKNSALTMTGISDTNRGSELVYKRINKFPE